MKKLIEKALRDSLKVKEKFIKENIPGLIILAEKIVLAFTSDRKLMLCGNGGSAADAQHFACELVGRFLIDRKALPVTALSTDTSVMTSIGNDYGFQAVFSKQVEGLMRKGDVMLAMSTSGNSPNLIGALMVARELGATTIGLLGRSGGKMKHLCHHSMVVPCDSTPRIQEAHGVIIHIICELVEKDLFGQAGVFA